MFALFRKKRGHPRCAALVPAAGVSSRMGGINKQLALLDGIPVLVRTLTALQRAERVDEIIIAAREEDLVEISSLCRTYGLAKCTKIIRGGEDRVHSVLLAAMEASPESELLAVHDGARPLATPALIDSVIIAAARCGAAAPAVPLKDTVKQIRPDGEVERTLLRDSLRAVQTPQVFDASLLKAALQAAADRRSAVTDDCAAVEALGKTVYLLEGEEWNLKITTPTDLLLAETLLRERNT